MQIWRSKEVKNVELGIVSKNQDGSFNVTFQVEKLFPSRLFKYWPVYLEMYYEYSYDMNWTTE